MSAVPDATGGGDIARETAGANIGTSEYAERLELLYEVAEKASSVAEVSKLLEEILSVTQRILRASASSLFLIDQEKAELYVQAAGGEVASTLKRIRLGLDSGIAGWVANNGTPVCIADVTGDSRFNNDIDRVTGFTTRSLLAVPLVRGRKVIGVLEVLNRVDGNPFNEQDVQVLTGLASTEALILLVSMAATAIANIKLSQTVLDGYKSTVETLVAAAEARDPFAWGHSQRVKEYTLLAADSLSFSAEELSVIEFGALLHDIGKIGINENILRKSGQLTAEEWYNIRKHPLKGASIVGEIPYLEKVKDIVLSHHEKYDGTGYPEGLKGDNIPLGARLVAVADAFDTMTTDHSYRAALSVDEAISELITGIGTQFCPVAVEAFIAGFKKHIKKLAEREAREVKKVKVAEKLARKEADQAEDKVRKEAEAAANEKAWTEPEEASKKKTKKAAYDIDAEVCEGEVQLVVPSPARFEQVRQFQERLKEIENLKIVMVGGSVDEGALILVSVQTPMPLARILKEMPAVETVEKVDKKGKKLAVMLKTPVAT